jgi:ABC-type Fe3+/spermidine/putrescine transport system ATPase subunit
MREILMKNVSKSFSDVIPQTDVIDNISLKIKKNEFIAFFGPNGCGKTTLFKLISGLEDPSKGKILIENKSPSEIKKSFVFQDYRNSIFPWLTVRKNVEFGFALKKIKKENIRKISEH